MPGPVDLGLKHDKKLVLRMASGAVEAALEDPEEDVRMGLAFPPGGLPARGHPAAAGQSHR